MNLIRLSTCLLFALALPARAQIGIGGVADKTIYSDQAAFTITNEAGFAYDARLDGQAVPVGAAVVVRSVDYHELSVWRTNLSTLAVSTSLVRFIVSASERNGCEDGLPAWTPHVPIPSASPEFAGAQLRVLAPAAFPAGYPIPVVAWVVDPQGRAVRVNGTLAGGEQPAIRIRRGVGSGFLAATNPAGILAYSAQIAGLQATNVIEIESNTAWTPVSGLLAANTAWPPDSRILVTGALTNPAGSTLTIGAGTIVRVNPATDIYNFGSVAIQGAADRLVVFMPATTGQLWGGFVQHASNASFTAAGAIFTGSGANQGCWFTGHGCSSSLSGITSHRSEQALISLKGANCNLTLTDCAAMFLAGQFGHSATDVGGSYAITLTRFLMQRCTTGGEFTDARFNVNDSAFIECPDDTANFVDGDNDALYIANGTHGFTNSLWGWTKDDGIDSGASGAGVLNFQGCWFESIFHEGNSLSGNAKNVTHYRDVFLDCGQGLEAGYDGPNGVLNGCLSTANLVGGRMGDNYNWTYTGSLRATNSLLLHNYREVWGMCWADWTYRSNQMDIRSNFLAVTDPRWPSNAVWNPATDSDRLSAFIDGPAGSAVGIGFALRTNRVAAADLTNGIPVRLSRFSPNVVSVDYSVQAPGAVLASGRLTFQPGETLKNLVAPIASPQNYELLAVSLASPSQAEVTGMNTAFVVNNAAATNSSFVLVPLGATWRYLDNGVAQPAGWMGTNWDDTLWSSGAGKFGFNTTSGNGPFTTVLSFGPSATNKYTAYYFRRPFVVESPRLASLYLEVLRDDGVALYLNGQDFYRNNLPSGILTYSQLATNATDNGATFQTATLPVTGLVAGTNLLAAEVHQSSLSSSDLVFDLRLTANPVPAPPTLKRAVVGGDLVLFWEDSSFGLEAADRLDGPWAPVPGAGNPQAIPIAGTQRFFRLKR